MRPPARRKKTIDYILPFLILISVGIIGVLGYLLWSNWSQQGKGDVYFYVVSGKARVLPYGQTDWDNAFSGSRMLLGDSLKTSTRGRVVMEFFEDTLVRMDADSAVTLTDVANSSQREEIALNLDNGSVWVRAEKSTGVKESHYEVRTAHLLVKADGTIFEVESRGTEVVRVLEGDVEVDIFVGEPGKERVADTVTVGVGQEITVDEAVLKSLEQNQPVSVLKAVSDSFKATEWFTWNMEEDESPTDFSNRTQSSSEASVALSEEGATGDTLSDGTRQGESQESSEEDDVMDQTQQTEETEEEDSVNNDIFDEELKAPVIVKPTAKVTETGKLVISGTVGSAAVKVVVENVSGGKEDSYTLGQFQKGDTSWSYNIAPSYGNIAAGENIYTVYAVDEDGNKSDEASITITYDKPEEETQESAETVETSAAGSQAAGGGANAGGGAVEYGF